MKQKEEDCGCADKKPKGAKTIIVCAPGNQFSNNFLKSWSDLMAHLFVNKYYFTLSTSYNSLTQRSRMHVMGLDNEDNMPFGGAEFDYMLLIDSDMVFRPEHFDKLIEHDVPVVSGLYRINPQDEMSVYRKDGWLKLDEHKKLAEKGELIEGEYGGLGWTLIKRCVFEKLKGPLFYSEDPKENYTDLITGKHAGEDTVFFRKIQRAGFKTYWDPTVQLGHEKSFIFI